MPRNGRSVMGAAPPVHFKDTDRVVAQRIAQQAC